jgi:hypothetical protein
MNQSILINDDMTWNAQTKSVVFSAINAGAIVNCQITKQYLIKKGLDEEFDPLSIIAFCKLIDFDIEEDAHQAINNEQLTSDGVLILD